MRTRASGEQKSALYRGSAALSWGVESLSAHRDVSAFFVAPEVPYCAGLAPQVLPCSVTDATSKACGRIRQRLQKLQKYRVYPRSAEPSFSLLLYQPSLKASTHNRLLRIANLRCCICIVQSPLTYPEAIAISLWTYTVYHQVIMWAGKSDFAWTEMMLLFRDKEPTFSLASSPVMINGNASSGEEDSRKKNPPAKILGMNSFRYSGCWRVNFLMK